MLLLYLRSMSEPWAPTVAHTYYVQGKITHQGNEYEKILKSVMKVQLKPEVNQTYDRIFFKLTVWCSGQVDLVKKACPKIKFVFNTRNPKSNLISFYQMGMSPVVADALEFDSTRIVHRLCPMPVNDPTGRFKLLRDNLLLKVSTDNLVSRSFNNDNCSFSSGVEKTWTRLGPWPMDSH